jgi:hypothetical protein
VLSLIPAACLLSVAAGGSASSTSAALPSTSPVVLAQRAPRQRPRPTRRRPVEARQQAEPKSPILDTLWDVFTPPGDYTLAIGAGVGTTFTETAFGTPNPNLTGRLQATYRPQPGQLPVSVYGAFDYLNYQQSAGELIYQSQFYTLSAGGGLQYWLGGTRLDVLGELNAMVRTSTQTDGRIDPVVSANVSPGVTLLAGGAMSLFGFTTLTMHAGARYHGLRSLDVLGDGRLDGVFLLGLEFLPDARPFDPY